jgi:1,2-diacylglycerol 3-beta-galactosyltransferase
MNNSAYPAPYTSIQQRLTTRKKRVLILTADTGFGHRSASNAIACALSAQTGGESECIILNPIDNQLAPAFVRDGMKNYDHTVRSHPEFYRLTYIAGDTRITSFLLEGVMVVLLSNVIRHILADIRPDLIISTYHLYNPPAAAALALDHYSAPLVSIVTDLSNVHKLWFHRQVNLLFVPNDDVRAEAIAFGIPPKKVIASGIPVHPRITWEARSRQEIREELGWNLDLPVLLVVGSRRANHLIPDLEAINRSGLPVQLIIVCGGDEDLHRHLQAVEWRLPVRLYQYVDNLSSMMHAADILISKAGGLILAEGLACGLPMILNDAIQGQETGNLAYITRHQAGAAAQSPDVLLATLRKWLKNDGEEMKRVARRSSQIGRPEAACQVAEIIWEAIQYKRQIARKE